MATISLRHLAISALCLGLAAAEKPIFYSNTWAGPAQVQQNGTLPFSSIEATLVMPRLELPANPEQVVDQYSASFWIGLDGYMSPPNSGLWQAGVVMHIWTNGTREYVPFWEWIPDPETFVYDNDFKVVEGDHVHIALNISTNGTMATATLNNLNTTKTISNTRAAPTPWRAPPWLARGGSAEWIVESGTYGNYTRHVLPDFGTAKFLDARAVRQDGSVVLPGFSDGLQMFENFGSDKEMLYTRSGVAGDVVRVEYVEEKCEACKEECLRAGTCSNTSTSAVRRR